MRKVTWAAVAAGLVVLAGCGATEGAADAPSPDPAPTEQALPASATQIRGWDIHYRDGDDVKVLQVEDFPRWISRRTPAHPR